jgi:hypothetical protein
VHGEVRGHREADCDLDGGHLSRRDRLADQPADERLAAERDDDGGRGQPRSRRALSVPEPAEQGTGQQAGHDHVQLGTHELETLIT